MGVHTAPLAERIQAMLIRQYSFPPMTKHFAGIFPSRAKRRTVSPSRSRCLPAFVGAIHRAGGAGFRDLRGIGGSLKIVLPPLYVQTCPLVNGNTLFIKGFLLQIRRKGLMRSKGEGNYGRMCISFAALIVRRTRLSRARRSFLRHGCFFRPG